MGYVRRHAVALLVVFVTVGFGLTAYVIVTQQNTQDRDDAAEALERRDQICTAFTKSQTTDRLLIDTVLDDSGGSGGTPLLDVPAYNSLPPTVRQYVDELAAASAPDPDDPPTLAKRLADFREDNLGPDDLPAFCT